MLSIEALKAENRAVPLNLLQELLLVFDILFKGHIVFVQKLQNNQFLLNFIIMHSDA